MALIEGYWDCPYCGNKAIRGGERTCPDCGKTRAAETKFYMLGTEPVADESAVEQGPDWYCPYCDSYSPSSADFCQNCGHPREQEDQDYFAKRREQEKKERENQAQLEHLNETGGDPVSEPRKTGMGKRILLFAVIAALIVACVVGLMPHNKAVTVMNKTWQRAVEIERNTIVTDSGWTVPADAIEVTQSRQEVHHYNQILDYYETVEVTRSREVQDGYDTYTTYEDRGNGYFEAVEHSTPRYRTEYYTETVQQPVYVNVPVYETKYYYTVPRWVYERTETASGTGDPEWPQPALGSDERTGARQERYTVTCADSKGKQTQYDCSLEIYSALETGGKYTIQTQTGRIVGIK